MRDGAARVRLDTVRVGESPAWRVVALLVALVGCGPAYVERYPDDLVQNFVAACRERSPEKSCRCAIDTLQRRYTLAQYREFERAMRAGRMPKEAADAVADCR